MGSQSSGVEFYTRFRYVVELAGAEINVLELKVLYTYVLIPDTCHLSIHRLFFLL